MCNQNITSILNEICRSELTTFSHYTTYYIHFENIGCPILADELRRQSILKINNASSLAERILYLKGIPDFKVKKTTLKEASVEEILMDDITLIEKSIESLRNAIYICNDNDDIASSFVLKRIKTNDENHLFNMRKYLEHFHFIGSDYLLQFTD